MMTIKEEAGIPKRDQLVDLVTDVQEAQQDAQKGFQSALDQFLALGGASRQSSTSLEKIYKKLQAEYEDAKGAVETMNKRIANTKTVSTALFKEWQVELGLCTNATLMAQSQQQYSSGKDQYDQLLTTMKTAASKMDPVLNTFREQALFLKHNLNAQAIGSMMNSERAAIESDVGTLIADIQRSIDEADVFMNQRKK